MKYICKCKNKSEITFNHFKQGVRCIECSDKNKLSYDFVKNYFEKKNCELLEEYYNINHSLLTFNKKKNLETNIIQISL